MVVVLIISSHKAVGSNSNSNSDSDSKFHVVVLKKKNSDECGEKYLTIKLEVKKYIFIFTKFDLKENEK